MKVDVLWKEVLRGGKGFKKFILSQWKTGYMKNQYHWNGARFVKQVRKFAADVFGLQNLTPRDVTIIILIVQSTIIKQLDVSA